MQCIVQCSMCNMQFSVSSVEVGECAMVRPQTVVCFAMYIVQCVVNVWFSVCSVQCAVCSVESAVVRPQSGQSACRVTAQRALAPNIEEHSGTFGEHHWTFSWPAL